jgi:hypothetical protein
MNYAPMLIGLIIIIAILVSIYYGSNDEKTRYENKRDKITEMEGIEAKKRSSSVIGLTT